MLRLKDYSPKTIVHIDEYVLQDNPVARVVVKPVEGLGFDWHRMVALSDHGFSKCPYRVFLDKFLKKFPYVTDDFLFDSFFDKNDFL